jgi:predicted Zn finger-like uncharacterized protein
MIATCPHCQNGFYISPDLAGNVVTCSKCKKQVRTPDRRLRGDSAQEIPSDGIPMAILAESKAEVEERLKTETEARAEAEKKLKESLEAKTRAEELAESESQAKTRIEQLMQAEVEARVKAESQAKVEAIARKKAQTQLNDEVEAREKAEEEAAKAKTKLRDAEIAAIVMSPINLDRGLIRLAFVLSLVCAGIAGLIAFRNGYIIWSHFDRPVRLPWSGEPVYLPIVLIAFCVAGFAAAWVAYLVVIFVINGFRQPSVIKEKKKRRPEPKDEEVVSSGECKMWRSS